VPGLALTHFSVCNFGIWQRKTWRDIFQASEKRDQRAHQPLPPPTALRPRLPHADRGTSDLGGWPATTENSGPKCRARRDPGQTHPSGSHPSESTRALHAKTLSSLTNKLLQRHPIEIVTTDFAHQKSRKLLSKFIRSELTLDRTYNDFLDFSFAR
jgi:hypothetical protein